MQDGWQQESHAGNAHLSQVAWHALTVHMLFEWAQSVDQHCVERGRCECINDGGCKGFKVLMTGNVAKEITQGTTGMFKSPREQSLAYVNSAMKT